MSEVVINIQLSKENFAVEYLKMVTFNALTPSEYAILGAFSSYSAIGRREKLKSRTKLGLSVQSMNNAVYFLKKKGYLEYDEISKHYTNVVEIPEQVDRVIFEMKVI